MGSNQDASASGGGGGRGGNNNPCGIPTTSFPSVLGGVGDGGIGNNSNNISFLPLSSLPLEIPGGGLGIGMSQQAAAAAGGGGGGPNQQQIFLLPPGASIFCLFHQAVPVQVPVAAPPPPATVNIGMDDQKTVTQPAVVQTVNNAPSIRLVATAEESNGSSLQEAENTNGDEEESNIDSMAEEIMTTNYRPIVPKPEQTDGKEEEKTEKGDYTDGGEGETVERKADTTYEIIILDDDEDQLQTLDYESKTIVQNVLFSSEPTVLESGEPSTSTAASGQKIVSEEASVHSQVEIITISDDEEDSEDNKGTTFDSMEVPETDGEALNVEKEECDPIRVKSWEQLLTPSKSDENDYEQNSDEGTNGIEEPEVKVKRRKIEHSYATEKKSTEEKFPTCSTPKKTSSGSRKTKQSECVSPRPRCISPINLQCPLSSSLSTTEEMEQNNNDNTNHPTSEISTESSLRLTPAQTAEQNYSTSRTRPRKDKHCVRLSPSRIVGSGKETSVNNQDQENEAGLMFECNQEIPSNCLLHSSMFTQSFSSSSCLHEICNPPIVTSDIEIDCLQNSDLEFEDPILDDVHIGALTPDVVLEVPTTSFTQAAPNAESAGDQQKTEKGFWEVCIDCGVIKNLSKPVNFPDGLLYCKHDNLAKIKENKKKLTSCNCEQVIIQGMLRVHRLKNESCQIITKKKMTGRNQMLQQIEKTNKRKATRTSETPQDMIDFQW